MKIIFHKKISFPPKKMKKKIIINRNYKTDLVNKQSLEELKKSSKEINIKISDIDNNNLVKKKTFVNSSISIFSKEIIDINGKKENPNIFNFSEFMEINKQHKNLSDYEPNELEHEEALKLDNRTFIQIYYANLKRENIILFTFFQCNDYNLLYIKIIRFLYLTSTDMAMNVFFFSDESMHKIYVTYGKFDFIQQIEQIFYSTLVSQLMEVFLCFLSLTDKHIYQIKRLMKAKILDDKNKMFKVFSCIKIKLVIFYIFSCLLFVCYWYIVSSFCAVYENTQIIFIKDCLFSFLFNLLFPIFIYLIPCGLRYCAIKDQKGRMACLYKLSDIIPFF